MREEILHGGVSNAGAVVRRGEHVLRPSNPYTRAIHGFLTALRREGFDGAPLPVGVEPDGRERLTFLPGDVARPPYPDWVQDDRALASVAALMRRFHDASRRTAVARADSTRWSDELADFDAAGDVVVCHNDVCLENVVFHDGEAVGLLDFDFAAPGRPLYDLAQFTRMCVPVDDDLSAAQLGWAPMDLPSRLRLAADAYGLNADQRGEFLEILDETIQRGGVFVLRRVEAGDPNFTRMWHWIGGMERFDRRRRWWAGEKELFVKALSQPRR